MHTQTTPVRITRLREDVALPTYATSGSVGFDLAAAEAAVIPAHGHAFVKTGLVIATPPGHVLAIAPRSSLFRKKGLRLGNQLGIVDQDYCGPSDEILIFLWNPGTQDVAIEKDERLAQGLFLPITIATWDEGPAHTESRGGWGSTGGYTS